MRAKRRRPPIPRTSPEELRREEPVTTDTIGGLDFAAFYRYANRLTRIAIPARSPLAPLYTHEEIERKLALYAEFESILNELRRSERTPLSHTLTAAARRRRAIDSGAVLDFKRKG